MLTARLFNDVLTNWDKAFFDEDYSYWRRGNDVRGKEFEDSYEYYVPLPGFKKENIKATVENGLVYVLAKHCARSRSSKQSDSSTASNSFLLPDGVDVQSLEAHHEDGLLTIKVSKKESERRIELTID